MTKYLVQLRPESPGPYIPALLDQEMDLFTEERAIARIGFGSQSVLGLAGTLVDDGWTVTRIHAIWPTRGPERPAHHLHAVERIILDDFHDRGWVGALDTLAYVLRGPSVRGFTAVRGKDRLDIRAGRWSQIEVDTNVEDALLDAVRRAPTMNTAVREPDRVTLRDRLRLRLTRGK